MRLADLQTRDKPPQATLSAMIGGAPPRMQRALRLARLVLCEDGSQRPIIDGAALDQPAWYVEAIASWHGALSKARRKKMDAQRRKAKRR